MSPAIEHALALWLAYDLAVIEDRRARAAEAAARTTWHPTKSRRRQLPPEAGVSRAATIRAAAAHATARDAYARLGLVFDESPNEVRAADTLTAEEPPEPVPVGTRAPVKFRELFPGMPASDAAAGCGRPPAPGE